MRVVYNPTLFKLLNWYIHLDIMLFAREKCNKNNCCIKDLSSVRYICKMNNNIVKKKAYLLTLFLREKGIKRLATPSYDIELVGLDIIITDKLS